MMVERLSMNPLARIKRFANRAGSPAAIVSKLAEEAAVRAWSYESVRSALRPLFSAREPQSWAFLVGCYNSGTTLLQHILSAHPEIAGLPREGVRFTDMLSNLETNGHHMMWDKGYRDLLSPNVPDEVAYRRILKDWAPFLDRKASIYLDKSVANAARVTWLDQAFPKARFVGIYRNGYCIAEGLHRRAIPPQRLHDAFGGNAYPLEVTGQQWVTANEDMLRDFETAEHSLLIRFEDLIADPITNLQSIFTFLGTDPPDMNIEDKVLHVAGKPFTLRNPNASSLARLSEDDKTRLKPVIGPMMHRLGYEP